MALEFRPPVTAARFFDKDKCLEPMFGDVGQARTNAAMLLMPIATTSSRNCTKPHVMCSTFHFYLNSAPTNSTVFVSFVYVNDKTNFSEYSSNTIIDSSG